MGCIIVGVIIAVLIFATLVREDKEVFWERFAVWLLFCAVLAGTMASIARCCNDNLDGSSFATIKMNQIEGIDEISVTNLDVDIGPNYVWFVVAAIFGAIILVCMTMCIRRI